MIPSFSASPAAQRGSSLAFSADSTAMSPPAFLTAATSLAGVFTRPSSRPKKLTVVSGGIAARTGASVASTSASFQRSTPSTIRNRRPMAKVIAFRASAIASGVDASPSKTSKPPLPDSTSAIVRRRARRSAMRP